FALVSLSPCLLVSLFRLCEGVNHAVTEQVAMLIEGGDFAAGAETRVDRQDAPAAERRLQEQAAQVAGKDTDGVFLGLVGQLPADLAFETGQEQAGEGVVEDLIE